MTSSSDVSAQGTDLDRVMGRCLAWCGPVYLVGILIFWGLVAGFIPPPHQSWDADRIATFFTESSVSIRIGMEVTIALGPVYFLWSMGIARVMRTGRDPDGILSTAQLFGGLGTAWITIGVGILWLVAAFRAGTRPASEVQLLNDGAWMIFDLTVTVLWTQILAVALWVFLNEESTSPYPRWFGWLSVLIALNFPAVMIMPFVGDGLFAWNGLLTFWIILGEFFVWMSVMSLLTVRARDER